MKTRDEIDCKIIRKWDFGSGKKEKNVVKMKNDKRKRTFHVDTLLFAKGGAEILNLGSKATLDILPG